MVDKFDPVMLSNCAAMRPVRTGSYVLHSDYADLEARLTSIISEIQSEVEDERKLRLAAESRLAELEGDAARYKWIVDHDEFEEVIEALSFGSDGAIDRAMSREA